MMIRLFLFCFLFVAMSTVPAQSQKQLKQLRAFVKAKNTGEAMKEVQRLERDSVCKFYPKLYELAVQTQVLINNVENEKVYLNQQCDTAKFFNSTLQIFNYALKGDSIERFLNETKGERFTLRKQHAELLRTYYRNLNMGARYFYTKANYKDAQQLLATALIMAREPMWSAQPVDSTHKEFISNIYRYTYSAYVNKDYEQVERYKHIMLNEPQYCKSALEIYARSAQACGKVEDFEKYLHQGMSTFTLYPYFFDELADILLKEERYEEAIKHAEDLLLVDSVSIKALELKAKSLYVLNRLDSCVEVSKHLVELDTAGVYPEAHYYVAKISMDKIAGINIPLDLFSQEFKDAKQAVVNICAFARPYAERYRALCPEEKDKWAPILYKIYLELNLGKEFEEICTLYQ
ncbi:MAG: hypothetical protein J6R91_00750 [Bacteroidaceae bacterium]|nr:hypothetical protein [Bacteroidaceae bacterium]